MPKYLFSVHCSSEWHPQTDYALIEITPQYAATLLQYMERFIAAKAEDKDLFGWNYVDFSPTFFASYPELGAQLAAAGYEDWEESPYFYGYIEVPDSFEIPEEIDELGIPEKCEQRLEFCKLIVDDYEVMWRATLKYYDCRETTYGIGLNDLRAMANPPQEAPSDEPRNQEL